MPFVPVPFAAPTYNTQQSADRVIDLMLRQGDVAAQGARAQGGIWGNAVAGLGQQAGNYLQQKQQQEAADAAQQKLAAEQARREAVYNDALSSWDSTDPEGSVKKMAAQIGAPDAIKFGSGMMSFQSMLEKNKKGEVPTLAETKDVIGALHGLKNSAPDLYAKVAPGIEQHVAPALQAHLGIDVSQMSQQEKDSGLEALGQQWAGENKDTKPADLKQQYDAALTSGDTARAQQILKVLKDTKEAGTVVKVDTGQGAEGLSPEGAEYAGTQYRITGVMPRMGQGKTGNQTKIINEAARQAKELGLTPAGAIQKQAAYKSDAASLTQMQKMSAATEAYESKALGQADIISELSPKVDRTNWPIINKGLLAGKLATGDQNTQLLFNALTTFTNEYGKIMEGSTGSAAGSTDAARAAASRLVSAALSKGTLAATLEQMKREMRLTRQGYGATIDHITERMGGTPTSSTPANAAGSKWHLAND